MKNPNVKPRQAVALSYHHSKDHAPKVVAKGKGDIANNILEKAKQFNVPIQEDPSLVALLGELEINETIPEELYLAVAEIFAFIYRLDQSIASRE